MAIDPTPPALAGGPAAGLRAAIEAASSGSGSAVPDFSSDGGVTVCGTPGLSARLQPLGRRTRISLSEHDRLLGEAEVDIAGLTRDMRASDDPYGVAVLALNRHNGVSVPV